MRSSPRKRKDIGLLILSAVDVITGILSLIITAFAIQVIAVMSSGLTLIKAVKIAVQSEKTAIFVKPVAIYAVRRLTRSEKMKNFFAKLRQNIKNNPVTLTASIFELVVCGGLGYALLGFFEQFAWAVGWKAYAVAFGAAAVVYAALVVMTVYLGHDNPFFAAIRKAVKFIGGDRAANVLDETVKETQAAIEAAEAEEKAKAEQEAAAEKAEAARKEEEEKIYQYAIEQEAKKKEAAEAARRAQLVNAYSDEFKRKNLAEAANAEKVQEIVNNANTHSIQG